MLAAFFLVAGGTRPAALVSYPSRLTNLNENKARVKTLRYGAVRYNASTLKNSLGSCLALKTSLDSAAVMLLTNADLSCVIVATIS